MTRNDVSAVHAKQRQGNWRWWLGGAGAVMSALKIYNMFVRWKTDLPSVGEFVTVENNRLHYIRRGIGRPVVLLHGNGLALQDFTQSIFAAVSAQYETIAFDRPGYGHSELPADEPLTLAHHAHLIHAALRELGIERALLVGHSAGAALALRYALDYPAAVTGLVLSGPSAYADGQTVPPLYYFSQMPVLGELFLHTLLAPLAQSMATQYAAGLFAPSSPPPGYAQMVQALLVHRRHFRAQAAELKYLPAALRDQSPRYGEIKVPVAILAGADDKIEPPETQAIPLQRALPNARLVTVSGSGHAAHHGNTALVLALLQQVHQRERME